MKYYHVSIKRHEIGQILHPRCDESANWGIHGIFFSNSPYPHFTTLQNGDKSIGFGKKYWIYEVRPLGRVERGSWDDLFCRKGIEIVKEIYNGKKFPEKTSLVERNRTAKEMKVNSNKPQWVVREKKIYSDGIRGGKILRGFKRKEAAEKYAAKIGGILDKRIKNTSKAEIEAYKKVGRK